MKHALALLRSLCVLLVLCGCRPSSLHGGITTAGTTETTETTESAPTREAKLQLEFFLEGMPEYQDATLFVGESYSLYITDDNWVITYGESGEITWTSGYNPDIVLRVIPNAGATLSQVKDTIFGGYTCFEEDGEYVYGGNDSGSMCRAARLIETPQGILAAVWDYSLEAAEGFGVRLHVIAGTLEATD